MVAFGLVAIQISTRIYRRTLMRTNKSTTIKEALSAVQATTP